MSPEWWFERIKQQAYPSELYALLFALPKGADLHVHLSGCGAPADWYELAVREPGARWVRTTAACGHDTADRPATLSCAALRALPNCCQAG
jgi:adenosine deaminase